VGVGHSHEAGDRRPHEARTAHERVAQHLPLLEHLFPEASFVHLIRDGRDAALSFLSVPEGIMTEGWGYPHDTAGFAEIHLPALQGRVGQRLPAILA
jgi:hypothetical protein